jgi:hypothetical protein
MGTPLQNKLITRGFGVVRSVPQASGLVVQGYGPKPPPFVITTLTPPRLVLGQSGTKRRLAELDEIIVWAKLVEKNGVEPKRPVKGWIRVKVDRDRGYASVMAEHVGTRTRKAWEVIKISVQRLK